MPKAAVSLMNPNKTLAKLGLSIHCWPLQIKRKLTVKKNGQMMKKKMKLKVKKKEKRLSWEKGTEKTKTKITFKTFSRVSNSMLCQLMTLVQKKIRVTILWTVTKLQKPVFLQEKCFVKRLAMK